VKVEWLRALAAIDAPEADAALEPYRTHTDFRLRRAATGR
jgi:hypothetical protein